MTILTFFIRFFQAIPLIWDSSKYRYSHVAVFSSDVEVEVDRVADRLPLYIERLIGKQNEIYNSRRVSG